MDFQTIEEQVISLSRGMRDLRNVPEKEGERERMRETLRTIGRTAAFFGGFEAMTRLHDAVEEMTDKRNEIGDVLNLAWDGIGGWLS